jgi:hypothetical protein
MYIMFVGKSHLQENSKDWDGDLKIIIIIISGKS